VRSCGCVYSAFVRVLVHTATVSDSWTDLSTIDPCKPSFCLIFKLQTDGVQIVKKIKKNCSLFLEEMRFEMVIGIDVGLFANLPFSKRNSTLFIPMMILCWCPSWVSSSQERAVVKHLLCVDGFKITDLKYIKTVSLPMQTLSRLTKDRIKRPQFLQ